LLGLMERLPLPQLQTLSLGMGSLICLMMIVFFIDRYFMALTKIEIRSEAGMKKQILSSLMGAFFGLVAFLLVHEWEIQSNYHRQEIFKISDYQKSFTVEKSGEKLIVRGELRSEKMRKRLLRKLDNYIHQMGIEKIEWRYRGRDSP